MFIFVADLFKEQYVGGAELTLGSLIDSADLPTQKIMSSQVSVETMEQHKDRFWIFGNYSQLPAACLMYAIKNLNYSVVEFDYKYCRHRTEHLHEKLEGPCDCFNSSSGKLVAIFLAKSKITWWMSEGQRQIWFKRFPALRETSNFVLSSIFSDQTLDDILSLNVSQKNNKYLILGSSSWIKGTEDAIEYAQREKLEYEVIGGLGYKSFLEKLAVAKGLIHLPRGYDTCPRLVIEARLLNCKIIDNEFVQHRNEDWFSDSNEDMIAYLKSRASFFWEKMVALRETGLPQEVDKQAKEKHFSIVIPSYNCENWANGAVASALSQDYDNYTVYFIDDASTDNTEQRAKEAAETYPEQIKSRFKFHKNLKNKKALHNICLAIDQSPDDTIVVLLDGDDRLSSKNVLRYLNKLYSEEDIWLTTGSYVETGTGRVVKSLRVSEEVWNNGIRKFREPPGHPNVFSHLRTFKKALFRKIKPGDLLDSDGRYYRCTFDRALMYPMIEMAGLAHHKVIENILYVYNRQNPLAVDRVDRAHQLRIEQELRNKKPYSGVCL